MIDDMDLDIPETSSPPPAPRRNRSFLLVAGILGGIMVLALIAMVYYALVILPAQRSAAPAQTETAAVLATSTASRTASATPSLTLTASATNTETLPPPSDTPLPSETPITPIFTADPATATVNALLTQAALAQTEAATGAAATNTSAPVDGSTAAPTNTPTVTPSALPASGFAEDVGAQGLLAMAAVLLAVIFLARRLRAT